MKEFQGDLQIFFSDLNEKAQKEVLEFYGLTDPCEMYLDSFPITILQKTEEGDKPFTPEENKKYVLDVVENFHKQK